MANERAVTPKGIVSFPSVFTAKDYNGKSKYELTLLFDKGEDLSRVKEMAKEAAIEAWGKLDKSIKFPFKDGDEKDLEKYPIYAGKTFFSASSQFAPQLVNGRREPILDEEEFYAGCEARMSVSCYAWTYQGKRGISLNLHNVQKMADGTRIGGGRVEASDEFDAVDMPETESTEDDFEL